MMTQLAISDDLASTITAAAANRGRSTEDLQSALKLLAYSPQLARAHQELSVAAGQGRRCTTDSGAIILSAAERKPVLSLGVIHGKRDVEVIMHQRLS